MTTTSCRPWACASVPCPHGRTGYCHDTATPEQRAAFEQLHRHAYSWAHVAGSDAAEAYAGWYAARHYTDHDGAPAHPDEFERWRADRG